MTKSQLSLVYKCFRNSLRQLISREQWDKVRTRLENKVGFKEASKTGSTGMTALHLACGFQPPIDIVRALIFILPSCAMTSDIFGRLPLHEACKYAASKEVIDLIIEHNPMGAHRADQRGMTPLHHAVLSSCVHGSIHTDVIRSLSIVAPATVLVKDDNGETPIDIAGRQGGRTANSITQYLTKVAMSCSIVQEQELKQSEMAIEYI